MIVVPARLPHFAAWAALRHALWPDDPFDRHAAAVATRLAAPDAAVFVACDAGANGAAGPVIGFAEATLRHDYVNGCDTSPVAFLEGLYVAPDQRRRGAARALLASVAAWARNRGVVELASDTDLANPSAQVLHSALGFAETERVVFFRRRLPA